MITFRTLLNKYLLISLLVWFIIFFRVDPKYYIISIYILFSIVAYYFMLLMSSNKEKQLSSSRLAVSVILFNFVFIIINNIISYHYNNNYFVFSAIDASTYDYYGGLIKSKTIVEGFNYYEGYFAVDDFGMLAFIAKIYSIIPSNLLVNFVYMVLSAFTASGLYQLGKYVMSPRYSFFAALSFSVSSYFIWFNSSGLKESIMVFLIVYSFLFYYKFYLSKSVMSLIFLIVFLSMFIFFRPAIIFLFLASVAASSINRSKRFSGFITLILILISLVFLSPLLFSTFNRFLGSGVSGMISTNDAAGMVYQGNVVFSYLINFLAAYIGPLATIDPSDKTMLSFFSPGLIFKIIISVFFILGAHYFLRNKRKEFFPLIFFVLFESTALAFILEALELRKVLPHFPFIYLIGFGFIYTFNEKSLITENNKKRINNLLRFAYVGIFLLLIFWNYRY